MYIPFTTNSVSLLTCPHIRCQIAHLLPVSPSSLEPRPFPDRYGGHVIIMGQARGRVSAAEFHRMGQTNAIGRYPIHLHMLGERGNASFVSDCSVHESYYRAVVVHGTNSSLVTRNVAYDVVGHCFYLESGNEEKNELSYNLAAHVHTIGHLRNLKGQATNVVYSRADLGNPAIPADGAASPFYITNMYNNFTGNAAVGGFTGYAMVSLSTVISTPAAGPEFKSFVPKNRPTMADGFYGNSARSTGYFWNLAPCFYIGGILFEDPDNGGELAYIPGRVVSDRKPVDDDGDDAWFTFVNSKASLCSVGGGDWNVRSKWYNMDIVDFTERSFNAFGDVLFRNIHVRCRTSHGLGLTTPAQSRQGESAWSKQTFDSHSLSRFPVLTFDFASSPPSLPPFPSPFIPPPFIPFPQVPDVPGI